MYLWKKTDSAVRGLWLNVEVSITEGENVAEWVRVESSIKDLETEFNDCKIFELYFNTERKNIQEPNFINEVKTSIIEALKAYAEKDSDVIGEVCKRKVTQAVKGLQKWQE